VNSIDGPISFSRPRIALVRKTSAFLGSQTPASSELPDTSLLTREALDPAVAPPNVDSQSVNFATFQDLYR
jgi:hypothetical protein